MIRAILATVVVLLMGLLAYALLLAIGAVMGGWEGTVVHDQALGLGLHYGVVALRGLLPALWLALGFEAVYRRLIGTPARGLRLLAVALAGAALTVPTVLTLDVGGRIPHLRIDGPVNFAASVALIGLASFVAIQASRRLRPLPS